MSYVWDFLKCIFDIKRQEYLHLLYFKRKYSQEYKYFKNNTQRSIFQQKVNFLHKKNGIFYIIGDFLSLSCLVMMMVMVSSSSSSIKLHSGAATAKIIVMMMVMSTTTESTAIKSTIMVMMMMMAKIGRLVYDDRRTYAIGDYEGLRSILTSDIVAIVVRTGALAHLVIVCCLIKSF